MNRKLSEKNKDMDGESRYSQLVGGGGYIFFFSYELKQF